MTQRDPAVSLSQMRDAATRAIAIVSTRDSQDLVDDDLLDLALVRLLEILGEAANRVPRDDQIRLTAIPWSEIIGLRNRLIHGYDQIDLDGLPQTLWPLHCVQNPGGALFAPGLDTRRITRGQGLSIRAKYQSCDPSALASERMQFALRGNLPDFHHLVVCSARRQPAPIRAEGKRQDWCCVSINDHTLLS